MHWSRSGAIRLAETTVAKQLNAQFREPELEAEVINESDQYSELLATAFGASISTKRNQEENLLANNLNQELELLEDDVLTLADEDADIKDNELH